MLRQTYLSTHGLTVSVNSQTGHTSSYYSPPCFTDTITDLTCLMIHAFTMMVTRGRTGRPCMATMTCHTEVVPILLPLHLVYKQICVDMCLAGWSLMSHQK